MAEQAASAGCAPPLVAKWTAPRGEWIDAAYCASTQTGNIRKENGNGVVKGHPHPSPSSSPGIGELRWILPLSKPPTARCGGQLLDSSGTYPSPEMVKNENPNGESLKSSLRCHVFTYIHLLLCSIFQFHCLVCSLDVSYYAHITC